MSRLNDLIRQVIDRDSSLGLDLQREVTAVLKDRRTFGLNFERHVPEVVELPGRRIRRGDKVRVLPPRGQLPKKADEKVWLVRGIDGHGHGQAKTAHIVAQVDETETASASIDDLIVVAEFRDSIYPGLVSTGKVERGGDKPCQVVINAENYHALQLLLFTHRGKVDCIYIDPPYNTGARDWKYNNDYVESDDHYRHSKWLAFMERRLLIAKELLNPEDSVLMITIDERESNRLGMLIDQTFPESRRQMISTVVNPKGVSTDGGFRRADEYIYFIMIGSSKPARLDLGSEWSASARRVANEQDGRDREGAEPEWTSMMRRGSNSARADRPSMFYPIYADPTTKSIVEVGEPLPSGVDAAPIKPGLVAILPLRRNGSFGRWQVGAEELRNRINQGRVRLGRETAYGYVVNYLPDGAFAEVTSGTYQITGKAEDGSLIATRGDGSDLRIAPTQWKIASHNSSENGSMLLRALIPGRRFDFPKSLYAVEDTLRFFIANKPNAVVVDFFAGSGTTAHAVMRLNKRDNGRRQAILVTNNEVSADEQSKLTKRGLRPGDADWEALGICDLVTKPRVRAAITGVTAEGEPLTGNYAFNDEFPMSQGLEENAEFFTLTYEAPLRVASNRDFERISPLLWLRAGGRGSRIENLEKGWATTQNYGVLADFDKTEQFLDAVSNESDLQTVFVITDDDWLFESICRGIPEGIEPVRLYEAYLRNFEIEAGRAAR